MRDERPKLGLEETTATRREGGSEEVDEIEDVQAGDDLGHPSHSEREGDAEFSVDGSDERCNDAISCGRLRFKFRVEAEGRKRIPNHCSRDVRRPLPSLFLTIR
ncbi:hypothetical protein DM860_011117 [Cuscuta australis]|uniref:Uncharacterized protein n=1 Tax=Cuscuta australis TaxID=267555 RepID=A0A328DE61_9ASTE|nr:hypothetical protein DM860_011117 [Cuscuta australis]